MLWEKLGPFLFFFHIYQLILCVQSSSVAQNKKLILKKKLFFSDMFVCVEVLWPSQTIGVMFSAVSLHNHTFIVGRLSLSVLCTFYHEKLTTDPLESAEGNDCRKQLPTTGTRVMDVFVFFRLKQKFTI